MILDLITGFLALYINATNTLADTLMPAAPAAEERVVNGLEQLESRYGKAEAIPSILLENARYQGATALDAFTAATATATPVEALVNIYCTYQSDDVIRATTGTGFFIDSAGVVLTNAHVAQSLILADVVGDSECVIRTGNPAVPEYTADLLYISPAWLREHAGIINETAPKGTGERDYALLYINGTVDNDPMPARFPTINYTTNELFIRNQGDQVAATGYPAQTLFLQGADVDLIPRSAETNITEIMTFGNNQADVISIGGTIVGEQGSSGGPITNQQGAVIGVIVTRGDDVQFGTGSLRGITMAYIDRTMREDTGYGLAHNTAGDLAFRAQLYKETMVPFLRTVISWEL